MRLYTGNKVKAGWALEVLLINTSDACVVFPFNYGVKIYHQEDEKINFIANLVDYTSKNEIFLTPEGELSSQRLIAIEPDLTDFSVAAPQELHATITGHLCDDENVVITKEITFFVVP